MLKKRQKGPVLFIQQPSIHFPQGNMQEIYSSKRAENQEKAHLAHAKEVTKNIEGITSEKIEISKFKNAERAFKNNEMLQEVNESIDERYSKINEPVTSESKPSYSFKRLKGFKEMSLLERIDYLIDFPKQLPPVPCIFQTEMNSWKGTFLEKNDETLVIKLLDGINKSIDMQLLKDIRMIGFKR